MRRNIFNGARPSFDQNANLVRFKPHEHAVIRIKNDDKEIVSVRHPEYKENIEDWQKFRLTYDGGKDFVDEYLKKLSNREENTDWQDRKDIAYCPNFGGAAIRDIKNSIYQRIADVTRTGGSAVYQSAVDGQDGGVDLQGSTMGSFIGRDVIEELLVLSKVGVLVDNFRGFGNTESDQKEFHPYLDVYRAEDILSWAPKKPVNGFTHLLLHECVDDVNELGLPTGTVSRYRYYAKTAAGVICVFYDEDGVLLAKFDLDIDSIPFVQFDIDRSLMTDVADHQIALLNIESSDVSFIMKANYPFFYEFKDNRGEGGDYRKPVAPPQATGEAPDIASMDKEVKVGLTQGRQYPKGLDKPGFVNPNPETLKASMDKGGQIKSDIRLLVNLNLMNANPRRQSAESKEMDNEGLEASLSHIGLELQRGESEIAGYWHMFEGQDAKVKINYPKTYNLRSESDRQAEAERLEKLADKIPSEKFRRYMKQKIARILAGGDVTDQDMRAMEEEIEKADVLTSDPNLILSAHKAGLVDDVTASTAIGFDGKKVVPQAKKDRAERIKLTNEAQGSEDGAARGTPELDKGQRTSEQEKEDKRQRGAEDKTSIGSEQK